MHLGRLDCSLENAVSESKHQQKQRLSSSSHISNHLHLCLSNPSSGAQTNKTHRQESSRTARQNRFTCYAKAECTANSRNCCHGGACRRSSNRVMKRCSNCIVSWTPNPLGTTSAPRSTDGPPAEHSEPRVNLFILLQSRMGDNCSVRMLL